MVQPGRNQRSQCWVSCIVPPLPVKEEEGIDTLNFGQNFSARAWRVCGRGGWGEMKQREDK